MCTNEALTIDAHIDSIPCIQRTTVSPDPKTEGECALMIDMSHFLEMRAGPGGRDMPPRCGCEGCCVSVVAGLVCIKAPLILYFVPVDFSVLRTNGVQGYNLEVSALPPAPLLRKTSVQKTIRDGLNATGNV